MDVLKPNEILFPILRYYLYKIGIYYKTNQKLHTFFVAEDGNTKDYNSFIFVTYYFGNFNKILFQAEVITNRIE